MPVSGTPELRWSLLGALCCWLIYKASSMNSCGTDSKNSPDSQLSQTLLKATFESFFLCAVFSVVTSEFCGTVIITEALVADLHRVLSGRTPTSQKLPRHLRIVGSSLAVSAGTRTKKRLNLNSKSGSGTLKL